jgi:tetratricopeptide (TPR) repeat protein
MPNNPATCRRAAQHVWHVPEAPGSFTNRGSRERWRVWLLALAAAMLVCPGPVRASDFWDEVRNPGLFAHRAHLRKGLDALAANRAELALVEADAAIALCGACADGSVLRGRALAASGRHGEAVVAFENAMRLNATALDLAADALTAAFSAIHVGRPELGATILTRALALRHEPVERGRALAMLADALQAQGPVELKRAIAAYGEAMRDDEARKYVLLGLALALHREGEPAQALSLARRADGSDSNASGGWLPEPERAARLALWLEAIGDREAADQAWLRAADGDGPWCAHARSARAATRGNASQK